MRIVVQLTPEASREIRRTSRTERSGRTVLGWLQIPLTPVHPGTTDSSLVRFFEIEMADVGEASQLAERLRADPAVDAAYVKPDDELPSL